ncbi:MAG: nucleotidyltransferase family protein [Gemmatimonadetes bacterium]|nr:nucleotidyltransferase family protein [Gemmatimonadota bacterium]MXY82452.1 nucleotidyltransferase family protein [Gemmatimonadota bacterium]MYB69877.1 nucleotidyltransferase family protein [Gemmatimonadota bacterium]
MSARIDIPKEEIIAFCQRNHIRRMALFGSVLRDDFTPESDVDVLVEFEPDARIGYIGLAGLEIELDKILGRKVDLYTFEGIESSRNWLLRKEILSSTEAVYEQT